MLHSPRMKRSRARCFALLAGAAALLGYPAAAVAQKLTIAIREVPVSPDPHWTTQPANSQINQMYYDPLVRLTPAGTPGPWLAESWTRPDDTTWIFSLRKGVKFHDGSPFTAEDVKFSYERAGNLPGAPQSFRTYVRPIKSMEVVDANTLKITTNGPQPALLERLAAVFIISKKNGERNSNEDYNNGKGVIGTGAYKFVSWTPNDKTVVERNNEFWGPKEPWKRAEVRSMPADPSRLAALLTGDIDVMQIVPSSDINRLKSDPRVTVHSRLTGRIAYLSFNPGAALDEGPAKTTGPNGGKLTESPFAHPLVREALSIAIDRDAFVKRIYQGEAEAAGQYLPSTSVGAIPGQKVPAADPAKARQLLEKAGWLGKFKIELAVGSTFFPQSIQTAEAIAQSWTRAGVPTTVQSIAYPVYLEARAKGRIPVTVVSFVNSVGSPDSMFPLMLHSRELERGYGTLNYVAHKNPAVDTAIEKAEQTMDVPARSKLYAEAGRLALADHVTVPLWFFYAVNATKKNLTIESRADAWLTPMTVRPVAAAALGTVKQ